MIIILLSDFFYFNAKRETFTPSSHAKREHNMGAGRHILARGDFGRDYQYRGTRAAGSAKCEW